MTDNFNIQLNDQDLKQIQQAIRKWRKPEKIVSSYGSAMLFMHLNTWQRFVSQEWTDWDISEYNHDIGVRYWIQLAIENATEITREKLEQAISPLDEIFKARMHPCKYQQERYAGQGPFQSNNYFWESNTIYISA